MRPLELIALVLLAAAACGRTPLYDGRAAADAPPPPAACDAGPAADCGSPPACAAPFVLCAGACIDPRSSREHCGARAGCAGPGAGVACGGGEICSAGVCALTCGAPLIACAPDGCVDPRYDVGHCGACGRACMPGEACVLGECREARRCGPPEIITTADGPKGGGQVLNADVASDPDGDVFVAWTSFPSPNPHLFVSRFDAGARAWVAPFLLDSSPVTNGFSVSAGQGASLVQWNGSASFFDPAAGDWQAPEPIGATKAGGVFDGHGNVILVVDVTGLAGIWTRTLDPRSAAVGPLGNAQQEPGAAGPFALDAGGSLMMVTRAIDGGDAVARLARFDDAGRPMPESAPFGRFSRATGRPFTIDELRVQIAIDGARNAVALWDEGDGPAGGPFHIRAQRFDAAAGPWSEVGVRIDSAAPYVLRPTGGILPVPEIGLGPNGIAVLLWNRSGPDGLSSWATTLAADGATWTDPVRVFSGSPATPANAFSTPVSNLAMNDEGDGAFATFASSGGIWLSRFDGASRSWAPAELVADVSAQTMSLHFFVWVALANDGSAVVLWRGPGAWAPLMASFCE